MKLAHGHGDPEVPTNPKAVTARTGLLKRLGGKICLVPLVGVTATNTVKGLLLN